MRSNLTVTSEAGSSVTAVDVSRSKRIRASRVAVCAWIMLALSGVADHSAAAADAASTSFSRDKSEIVKLQAAGVQIYECKTDSSGTSKWQFREPLATLMLDGKTVGRHFAGPSWELSSGGAISAKVITQAPGATEKDIALLELQVSEKRGSGQLTDATTVQRVGTKGGVFAGKCGEPGALHLEPYTADYIFLK